MCNDVDLVFQLSRQYKIIFITYLLKPVETPVFCRHSTAVVSLGFASANNAGVGSTKHTVSLALLHAYS